MLPSEQETLHFNIPAALSVALTGRWDCHKVLQPVPHPLLSTTVAKGFWRKVFADQMPFLSPSKQHLSTEDTEQAKLHIIPNTTYRCPSQYKMLLLL